MPKVLMIQDFDKNGDRKLISDEGYAALTCVYRYDGSVQMNCFTASQELPKEFYKCAVELLSKFLVEKMTIEEYINFQNSLLSRLGG